MAEITFLLVLFDTDDDCAIFLLLLRSTTFFSAKELVTIFWLVATATLLAVATEVDDFDLLLSIALEMEPFDVDIFDATLVSAWGITGAAWTSLLLFIVCDDCLSVDDVAAVNCDVDVSCKVAFLLLLVSSAAVFEDDCCDLLPFFFFLFLLLLLDADVGFSMGASTVVSCDSDVLHTSEE